MPRGAELEGYGPVPVSAAERIAARAPSWSRILTHPVTGTVPDRDRTVYTVPADLKHRLRARDGPCPFPGCRWRAGALRPRPYGGLGGRRPDRRGPPRPPVPPPPAQAPGGAAGPVVHLDPQRQDGVLEWTSPAGQVHRTYPQEHHRSDPRPCPPEDPPPWTVCPSEAARALAPAGWRELMEDVRQEAYRLADDGLVDITQRDRVVDGRTTAGPIRVRLRRSDGDAGPAAVRG